MPDDLLQPLREMLSEVLLRNPFWQKKLQGIDVATLQSPHDLDRLPFLFKPELVADQAAHPPYGSNLTDPRTRYTRVHGTSGTTGRPLRCLDTAESWQWVLSCWEQIYSLIGIRDDDVFAFPFSFGPFLGFWAAFEGAQKIGRMCLAGGGLSSEARLRMIEENSATVVCCTPTYALRLAEAAAAMGMDLANGPVRAIVVAGEPGGNVPAIRERIESAWDATVYDHWGMTEVGPLAVEPANDRGGLQMLAGKCLAEVIDPATGKSQTPGELGELVVTNLGRWGQPMIRYRTGDLVRERPGSPPLSPYLEGGVLGRTDDMFIVRGNNVFPTSVEAVLREFDDVVEYRMTLRHKREMPHLMIEVEPRPECDTIAALCERIHRRIKDRLNFQPEILAVGVGELPRFELKGRRFIREQS
ncbi:Phenylacetate-coenzyme A ligase [Caulifigura coniformis]|uniref:Phenylacetate-coenzyme A ligase n=1 Tax=Caulifigura coniformis TaxID=2527983 RepID=A0A517SK12_9PLAN|nr:AMP-binding protein [Caulifigura coniformis]QDT56458.1 Phenylacetate-coenzyme A ligase [Caulifigura coniformis]